MKPRLLHYTSALLIGAAPLFITSCGKDESSASGGGASKSGASASASSASTGEVSASAWGFAARLPKTTEGFVAFYRSAEMVEGFLGSNWFKKLTSLPPVAPQWESVKSNFASNPQAKEALALAREIAGKEAVFVLGEGATESGVQLATALAPLLKVAFMSGMQTGIKRAAEGGEAVPTGPAFGEVLANLPPEQIAEIVNGLVEVDVPPLLAAVKAGSVREKIDAFMNQALASMPPEAQQKIEKENFGVGGNKFQSLKVTLSKAMPPEVQEGMKQQLAGMLGDPAKGAAAAEKVLAKTIEASWGWVDDYLVLGIGKDHSHVRLATLADSVLSLPEVAPRAAAWQDKNPVMLSYVSQETNRALGGMFGGIMGTLASLAEAAKAGAPFPLDPLIADLRKLDVRAKEIWPNDPDAAVSAAWWDAGMNVEVFGGPKPRAFDASKPLTYESLAGPATMLLYNSRVNEAESDKTFAFVGEAADTLYSSFQKNILPNLPDEQKTQIGLGAGMAVGMVQAVWNNFQAFRASLGAESAVLVNLDGTMPPLPDVPAELKDMKVPRMLMVSELKDREKLTAAWKGIGDIIGGLIAMTKAPLSPTPAEKKEGDVTMWGWELPMPLGDHWPHFAVAGNHWYAGTSPTFTTETAAKAPAASGPSSGMHLKVNFAALWTMVDNLVSRIPAEGAEQKAMMTEVLPLLRSLSELDARCGAVSGTAHHQITIRMSDAK
jgi:hypothetical protein